MRKLRDYAREHGVTCRTAYNHFKRGLITRAYQLPTGTIVIPDDVRLEHSRPEYAVTYARVSSSENKDNLERQSQRLRDFCAAKGWVVKENIQEVGSGVNDSRKKLCRVLKEGQATRLVVEHKDRLTRFGFNYLRMLCDKTGCEVVVVNEAEGEREDLVGDFAAIITSFCARLYGQRRNKRRTERLIKELQEKEA
jgi:predicted site-specific integrase-resolvase